VATCAWCQQQLRELDFLRDALRRGRARDTAVSAASSSTSPSAATYRSFSREEIRAQSFRAPEEDLKPEVTTEVTTTVRAPVRRFLPSTQQGRAIPIVAVAAVLLIALLAAAVFGRFANGAGSPPSIGHVIATISGLGAAPEMALGGAYELAATDDAVWVHNGDTGMLIRIDPRTNTIVARIQVGHGDGSVTFSQGVLWVANPLEGTISRIDPQTNAVVATIPLENQGNTIVTITTSPGAVWATDFQRNMLIRIDPQTNSVVARLTPDYFRQAALHDPIGVSFAAGSLWECDNYNPTLDLTRLDPQSYQVQARITLGASAYMCTAVVALDPAVWAMTAIDEQTSFKNVADTATLQHIDPATNKVIALIAVRADPYHFAADTRAVWVISPHEGLSRIDPQTNRVVGSMALPGAAGVAIGAGAVWVADGRAGALLRISPAP
jgi:DNA-binding beta-propeller fold protein YncE